MLKRERRFVPNTQEFRVSQSETGEKSISGYAVVYGSISEDMGFREVIRKGAFTDYLATKPDVRCLFNHSDSQILGRTTAGTLVLTDDEHGLAYRCTLPDTTVGRDLAVSISRGDVTSSSFGFTCDDAEWSEASGYMLRTIKQAKLFDVSPVVFPAYQASSVGMRSLFPDGEITVPKPETRDDTISTDADDPNIVDETDDGCNCVCASCVAGNCSTCTDCSDPDNCDDGEVRSDHMLVEVIAHKLR